MFGLGWMEMLIIGGAIMLLAGPVVGKRLLASAKALDQTRRDLTGPGAIDRLLGDEDEEEPRDRASDD
ncbi:MAG: twin-arginine translocase TatA/TatE family subunit [Myxococcota bacterium]|nr:twin-arginine translocase TatA/TatE family subunit [Myxococcota bacterium]